jgi:hypothetical protein
LKVNHQLESRVPEICLPGSEGGAKLTLCPYPYLVRTVDRLSKRLSNV